MAILRRPLGVLGVGVLSVLALLWAWPAAAAAATGSLVICKGADGGAAGHTFTFTAAKGRHSSTVSVAGGSCSAPLTAAEGTWKISEDLSGGWAMAHVSVEPSSALVSTFKKRGRVKVTVAAGQETRVTVVNAAPPSSLQVCTWSGSPTLGGISFSFSVGGQTLAGNAGWSFDTAGCTSRVTVQPGDQVEITEAVPAGVDVTAVTVGPVTTLDGSAGGVADVTVGAGANVVTFENEVAAPQPPPPPGGDPPPCAPSGCGGWSPGGLKICKLIDPGSAASIGAHPYSFTWSDLLGNTGSGTVYPPYPGAQSCTGLMGNVPIVLPSGALNEITVTEVAVPNVVVASVDVSNGTVKTAAGLSVTFYPGPGVDVVTFTNRWATG